MLGFGRCKRFDAFLDRYNLGHQILGNVTFFSQFWQIESRSSIFLFLNFRLLFLKSILRFLCFFFGLLESRGEYSFQFPVFRLNICQTLLDGLAPFVNGIQKADYCLCFLVHTDFVGFGRNKSVNVFDFGFYLANLILSKSLSTQ